MSNAKWNPIKFEYWACETTIVRVSTNEYGEGPIVVTLEASEDVLDEWLTPDQAREVAAVLIKAADACDAAGRVNHAPAHMEGELKACHNEQ